ncbi:MAG: DUF1538 domain-containing protein [Acholeplasmataceae bacterium]|nr:DUF1538 domain-containing protein [Acholeplasmataceae bacterium]
MPIFSEKLKENIFAIMPILFIVFFVHFFFTPLETPPLVRFIIGALLIIIGLALFLVGIDLGITPLGSLTGQSLTKTNKLWIVLLAAFILGFFISIAEPGLLVYANQIETVTQGGINSTTLLLSVSVGLAILVGLGFLRIIYNMPLYRILLVLYIIIFVLALFAKKEYIAIAFDASGATTGVLAVPFLLSLSVGISRLKKNSKSSEKDSFGLVSIASAGAIIAVLILSFFVNSSVSSVQQMSLVNESRIIKPFFELGWSMLKDSFMALLPLLVILILMQIFRFKLSKRQFRRIIFGFIYAFLGLFLFFLGVNGGFMEVGLRIGYLLAGYDAKIILLIIAFMLGLFTIIAEPAVSVLTHQIEDITAGYVRRKAVLVALSLGVGLAIMASVLKIMIPSLQLWHIILPGYILSLTLMFFSPKLFVGIAFDAGGVATGPLTATFILAFIQGVAISTPGADVVIDGFGMIALVALAPIITLQILGIIFKIKTRKEGV